MVLIHIGLICIKGHESVTKILMRAFVDEVTHDLDIYFTAAVDCSDFVEQAFYLKTKTLLLPFAASGLPPLFVYLSSL